MAIISCRYNAVIHRWALGKFSAMEPQMQSMWNFIKEELLERVPVIMHLADSLPFPDLFTSSTKNSTESNFSLIPKGNSVD